MEDTTLENIPEQGTVYSQGLVEIQIIKLEIRELEQRLRNLLDEITILEAKGWWKPL